ncbi:hypothetical protein AAU61_14045 [Desulfocarbo indianensis]|nr:hypothetical protein AAU61_14045 [Desulfocarbo indianensis]
MLFIKARRNSLLAFDYTVSLSAAESSDYYGAAELITLMKAKRPDESFRFSVEDGKIESFLAERGLRLVKHYDPAQIMNTFLLAEDGKPIGRPNGLFRLTVAAPSPSS